MKIRISSVTIQIRDSLIMSIGIKNINRVLISFLAILFVLSVSLHNHVFGFGDSSKGKVLKTEQGYVAHYSGFCSACRLNGNLKQTEGIHKVFFNKFAQLIEFLNLDLLLPSSLNQLKKLTRSPPSYL